MNDQPFVFDFLSEPERYELHENPWNEVDRRDFFRIAGAGVVIALLFHEKPAIAQQRGGRGGPASQELGAWIHIGEDSAITAYTGKVEIGQNIRTSFTQVIAEELHVPVGRIRLIMADTDLVPFDGGTAGSQSTPMMASQLRRVAASAREVLLDLAADEGKVERQTLTVKDGKIAGPDGKPSFEFGHLTKGKKLLKTIRQDAKSIPAADWTIAGTSVSKVDGPDFVTGKHQYASDIKRPGMVFGKVLRPPAFKATLVKGSLQTQDAEAMPGVTVVHDGDFIGVVAPTEHAAEKALAAIKAEWTTVEQPSWEELSKYLKEHRGGAGGGRGGGGFGGKGGGNNGSVKEGLKIADFKVESSYPIAFIAHFPLEPRAAVAEFQDGKLTVWTGSQRPFGVRTDVATAVGLAAEKVRVIIPDMGSGYGGKHTGDAAIEAARLAKAVKKPVKLVWTRQEEFTWAYFRPGGVIDIAAGVKKDGTLVAWEAHNYNSGASALRSSYEIANQTAEFHGSDSPLRQGSYRALASTANNFARESHMDDLAHAVQMDPLTFRLKNLKNERLRGVLEAAAKQFGWGTLKPPEGHGFGLALGTEKNSFVATCAEVAADVKTGRVKVIRVVTAFDCGAVLNPDHLKNQIEGATMMGLGGALYEAIQFANGKILNPNLAGYKVARFADTPAFETVLVNRKEVASAGAGETPIIGIAPAVGNAIFQATGIRLRSLPMVPNGLKGS
jgi:nicotinate dehydrogenase subunit B